MWLICSESLGQFVSLKALGHWTSSRQLHPSAGRVKSSVTSQLCIAAPSGHVLPGEKVFSSLLVDAASSSAPAPRGSTPSTEEILQPCSAISVARLPSRTCKGVPLTALGLTKPGWTILQHTWALPGLSQKYVLYIYIYYYVPLQNEDDMSIETASCDVNLYDILRLKLNFGG